MEMEFVLGTAYLLMPASTVASKNPNAVKTQKFATLSLNNPRADKIIRAVG